jgi:hypothetical protein
MLKKQKTKQIPPSEKLLKPLSLTTLVQSFNTYSKAGVMTIKVQASEEQHAPSS